MKPTAALNNAFRQIPEVRAVSMPRNPTIDTARPRVPAMAVLLLMPFFTGFRGTNEYPAIKSTIPQPKYINILPREIIAAALARSHDVYNLMKIRIPMTEAVITIIGSE